MTERPDAHKLFPAMMERIIAGEITPPNIEHISNDRAVYNIATFNFVIKRGQFRNLATGSASWATYFLNSQNGRDGEGFALYYGYNDKHEAVGCAVKFAICKHKKTEEGHQPNHMRGWHPGHCELCGLDMSVDSGD